MQFKNEVPNVHKEMRVGVLAAMETGNTDRARTLLREYAEYFPDKAKVLRMDVTSAYGVVLG
jgi:hypothetical protein